MTVCKFQDGLFSAIPYIVFWAFINISGLIADYMRAKGVRTTVVRKIMVSIGKKVIIILIIIISIILWYIN